MKIHVLTSKSEINKERIDDKVIIVLDILFATTSIVTAFENGCREVLVARSSSEALNFYGDRLYSNYILSGELNADTLEGFVHPTPIALTEQPIEGTGLIYCTTNGTVALYESQSAQHIYAASLLNGEAIVKHILKSHLNTTVIILCSGSSNQFNLEDFFGAGQLVSLFRKYSNQIELTDAAIASQYLYESQNSIDALKASRVGQMMLKRSLEHEVIFAAQENIMQVIPKLFQKNILRDERC